MRQFWFKKILTQDLLTEVELDLNYAETGIPGLDRMLDNRGIPSGYSVSIIGAPGAGKTTLSMQFLYNGVKMFGERGIYVSLNESFEKLKEAMKAVGIDLSRIWRKGLTFIDATHLRDIPEEVDVGSHMVKRGEYSLVSIIESIRRRVEETNAKRIVIDPLGMLTVLFPNDVGGRVAVADLIQQLSGLGATTLLISELPNDSPNRSYRIEDYLSQGAIVMRKITMEHHLSYVIQIERMRGIQYDNQPRLYKIGERGINVLPTEFVVYASV